MSGPVTPEDWDEVDWNRLETDRGHLRTSKILHLIPDKGIHLDVGTGRGDGTLLISKKKKCIGFDYGLVSTAIAKSKGLEVCQADARRMPFKSDKFSSITCLDVLEHIPEPNLAIAEIYRVLDKDGVFILQSPTSEMFKERLLHFIRRNKLKKQKQPYDSPLKLVEIQNLLARNHFEIISQDKIKYWAAHPLIRLISYSRIFKCRKKSIT